MKTEALRRYSAASYGCRIGGKEDGFVLVLSLMVLVVLTLLGISATETSVIEVQIAGNENMDKMVLYNAEAAAHEAAQRLENEQDENRLKAARTPYVWLTAKDDAKGMNYDKDKKINKYLLPEMAISADDLRAQRNDNWRGKEMSDVSSVDTTKDIPSDFQIFKINSQLAAQDWGVVNDSSLKEGNKLYLYKLFGRAWREKNVNGNNIIESEKIIEIGYKKRY